MQPIEQTANPLKILKWVAPQDLLEGQPYHHLLVPLKESIESNPLSDDIETLLKMIYEKKAVLWTWGDGILITYLKSFPKHKNVLVMTNLRGKGYIQNIGLIEHDINEIAKAFDCPFIIGETMSAGLVKVYERLGAKAIYSLYREVR